MENSNPLASKTKVPAETACSPCLATVLYPPSFVFVGLSLISVYGTILLC